MLMLIHRLIKLFTSLKLTVVLLGFAIVLVFIGTLAQVDEGLYNAQARYFRQWFIFGIDLFGHRIPLLLPGGYLIGTLLLINLLASHIYRFQLTTKKIGIQLIHAGIILLLVGQLATDMLAKESQIHFVEGETKSYSESALNHELAFTTPSSTGSDETVVIPYSLLERGGEIKNEKLPFTIRVKSFWKNSRTSYRSQMVKNDPPLTTNGIAPSFDFHAISETNKPDEKNVPTALIEIIGENGSLGDWIISGWTADDELVEEIRESYGQVVGPQLAQKIVEQLTQPQSIQAGDKTFTFALRPERIYHPFSLKLLKATHTVYEGTEIPKDFRSRVLLRNAQTGENREVEISMNHPLRYAGLTFYQYQMDAGEAAREAGRPPSSVLQVVHNPSWLTPYLGCALVAIGLMIQFMFHLVGYLSKAKAK